MTRGDDTLRDALRQLSGWSADSTHISRTLDLDESQHADLTERIKIFADALELRPDVRRFDGCTRIVINRTDGTGLTEVKFAARVEHAYRTLAGPPVDIPDEPTTGAIRTWWHRRAGR